MTTRDEDSDTVMRSSLYTDALIIICLVMETDVVLYATIKWDFYSAENSGICCFMLSSFTYYLKRCAHACSGIYRVLENV